LAQDGSTAVGSAANEGVRRCVAYFAAFERMAAAMAPSGPAEGLAAPCDPHGDAARQQRAEGAESEDAHVAVGEVAPLAEGFD
jgi:hypothetical protein